MFLQKTRNRFFLCKIDCLVAGAQCNAKSFDPLPVRLRYNPIRVDEYYKSRWTYFLRVSISLRSMQSIAEERRAWIFEKILFREEVFNIWRVPSLLSRCAGVRVQVLTLQRGVDYAGFDLRYFSHRLCIERVLYSDRAA